MAKFSDYIENRQETGGKKREAAIPDTYKENPRTDSPDIMVTEGSAGPSNPVSGGNPNRKKVEGYYTDLLERAEDIRARVEKEEDIAHSLSQLCRFGGHCNRFYSVAEHSVLVGRIVGFHGLVHDTAEAYMIDVPRPIKSLWPGYKDLEALNLLTIYRALGLIWPSQIEKDRVKDADNRMLATEVLALFKPSDYIYPLTEPYTDVEIECWKPRKAEILWLDSFGKLTT